MPNVIFTPDIKDLSIFELTKKYWNKEAVRFNVMSLMFEKKIGCKPDVIVKQGNVSYDYLSRSEYFDSLFDKF